MGRRLRLAVGVAGAMVVALPGVPGAAQTLDDLDVAERRVEELEGELDAATAAYETTWARIEAAQVELEQLQRNVRDLERDANEARRLLANRARAIFKRGTTFTFQTLLTSDGSQAAVERAAMIAALQLRDGVRIERADAASIALAQARGLVEDRERALEHLHAQLEADARVLQDQLRVATADASAIRTLVARQRRIDRDAQQGIYSCIFDRGVFHFRDTWGAPRSGGRRHRGTDVFAPTRAQAYAFTSGVVQRHSRSRLGGLGLYLRGDDGNVYYYAHLDSIDPTASVGRRLVAGEPIARNGSTGNATPNAPHVHFELHPGGGGAVNPYPWLAAACL